MEENKDKLYGRLEKLIKCMRLESLFLSLAVFCFAMAIMCLPLELYNNPAAAQNLFNLVVFQPMFRYVFLVFLVAGFVFLAIAIHMFSRQDEVSAGAAISPEDRVRIADKNENSNEL